MNYYERYCGDYQRDTAHLSMCEHGAYTQLLDTYYATARPLPADYALLNRICRAMNRAERVAVKSIADQYFPVSDDGLRHNRRADEMIAQAHLKITTARANGHRGGRPPKNPEAYETVTQKEPDDEPNANPAETQTETQTEPSTKPNENPDHNPDETQHESSPAPTPAVNQNLKPSEKSNDSSITRACASAVSEPSTKPSANPAVSNSAPLDAVEISKSLIGWERERGKAVRGLTPSQQPVIDLASLSVAPDELRRAYDDAVAQRDATGDPQPVNAGFVRSFIEKHRRPERPKREPPLSPWAMNDIQINALGRTLGIGDARVGEARETYIRRIQQAQHDARGKSP